MANKKAITALRVIFAIVTIAYIVGTVLALCVFDMDETFKLADKKTLNIELWNNKVWKLQLIEAKKISVEQILWSSLPAVLFIFSLIGWSLDRPAGKKDI